MVEHAVTGDCADGGRCGRIWIVYIGDDDEKFLRACPELNARFYKNGKRYCVIRKTKFVVTEK